MTERVLPTEETETEFFNRKRAQMGFPPTQAHVTKIRPGLHTACGCEITEVTYGVGFIVKQVNNCVFHRGGQRFVPCDKNGQAVCSVAGDEGELIGVMTLDQPFPHGV